MGRFSPTVLPDTGESFGNQLARALQFMRQSKMDKVAQEERDWEREWMEEERRRGRETEDLELAERGYKRFQEPPTVQQRPEAPPVFQGARMGMADREETSPLAQLLGPGGQGGGKPVALPGQLILGPGGPDFAPETIYAGGSPLPPEVERIKTPDFNWNAERDRLDLGQRRTVEAPDPRYEHMTGSVYRDVEAMPPLAQALGMLRYGASPEENRALAYLMENEDLPASVVASFFAGEEEEEGFTPEALLAAGVDEPLLAAALRDPILARRLIERELEPEEEPEKSTIRVGGRDFPNTAEGAQQALAWEREVSAAGRAPRTSPTTGEPTDEAYEERRKGIVAELGLPETQARQIALDQLASGMSPEEILGDIETHLDAPPDVKERVKGDVERYLRGYGGNPFRVRR